MTIYPSVAVMTLLPPIFDESTKNTLQQLTKQGMTYFRS